MNSRHPDRKEEDRLDFTLIPIEFEDVVKVLEFGVKKGYEKDGWQKGIEFNKESNLASIRRHANAYRSGVDLDAESGLNHMLHIACRSLMQYTLDKRKQKELEERGLSKESLEKLQKGLQDSKDRKLVSKKEFEQRTIEQGLIEKLYGLPNPHAQSDWLDDRNEVYRYKTEEYKQRKGTKDNNLNLDSNESQ